MNDKEDWSEDQDAVTPLFKRYYLLVGVLCVPVTYRYWSDSIPPVEISFGGILSAVLRTLILFGIVNLFAYLAIFACILLAQGALAFNKKVRREGQFRVLAEGIRWVVSAVLGISSLVGLIYLVWLAWEIIENSQISDNILLTLLLGAAATAFIIVVILPIVLKLLEWIGKLIYGKDYEN